MAGGPRRLTVQRVGHGQGADSLASAVIPRPGAVTVPRKIAPRISYSKRPCGRANGRLSFHGRGANETSAAEGAANPFTADRAKARVSTLRLLRCTGTRHYLLIGECRL